MENSWIKIVGLAPNNLLPELAFKKTLNATYQYARRPAMNSYFRLARVTLPDGSVFYSDELEPTELEKAFGENLLIEYGVFLHDAELRALESLA